MRAFCKRPTRLATWLSRIGLDRRGVAAVEFALILPVLIALFLGLSELQPGISIKRKLGLVGRIVADLSARSGDLATNDLKTIFGASTAIMRPYDDTGLTQMVVSSVAVTKVGNAYVGTVEWSCIWNPKSEGDDLKRKVVPSVVTVPDSFKNDSTKSYIMVETLYPYKPIIGYTITGTFKLTDTINWPVRDAEKVKLTGSSLIQNNNCPVQT